MSLHSDPFSRPVDVKSLLTAQCGTAEGWETESDDGPGPRSDSDESDGDDGVPAAECQATGNKCFKDGKLDLALLWYARALAALVKQADVDLSAVGAVLCNRSAALVKLGRHDAACADAAQAVELQPDQVKPHYRHACALRALGRHDAAVAACDKGLALAPGHAQLNEVRRACRAALAVAD
eukprot:1977554-Prymnesium_polylepis.1